jgi:hypothetical protein
MGGGGGDKLKRLVLGRNRIADVPVLELFAHRVGGQRVLDLSKATPRGMALPEEILYHSRRARNIHFNLAEMDVGAAYRSGKTIIAPEAHPYGVRDPGFTRTNWELAQVIDNPKLRGKTIFHLGDGRLIRGRHILPFVK